MEEITPDLIDLIKASDLFCPHLHIPLQSGDDRLLGTMNRHYSTDQYQELVQRLDAEIPLAAIGADVLVGFPGEDDLSFRRTLDFLSALPLSYLHVFPYSPVRELRRPVFRTRSRRRSKKNGPAVFGTWIKSNGSVFIKEIWGASLRRWSWALSG